MTESSDCTRILGAEQVEIAVRAGRFLQEKDAAELLRLVGQTETSLAVSGTFASKRFFPASYGGGKPCGDDLLAAEGLFYVNEAGKIMLDCTGGHYQMTWGYNHPGLYAALRESIDLGIVWDNHSNIPSLPVKLLSEQLVDLAGDMGINRVLLGICTGSVACSTALKIMLARYFDNPSRVALGVPVVIALVGNYHGTDIAAQTMRGMWPGLLAKMEPVQVPPNDPEALQAVFAKFGKRVAGFWVEPVMMNREAILIDRDYLGLARELCDQADALIAVDEIQTGFWHPEILFTKRLGIAPDLIIAGKGMTAGFHPMAAVLYRRDLDILAQYDSISTNGNAALAAFMALCNLDLIRRDAERIARMAEDHFAAWESLAGEFADLIEGVNGAGLLSGLRFRKRDDALAFHRVAVERGLWLRVHAYHEGHRTVLAKLALAADEKVVKFVYGMFREILMAMR